MLFCTNQTRSNLQSLEKICQKSLHDRGKTLSPNLGHRDDDDKEEDSGGDEDVDHT